MQTVFVGDPNGLEVEESLVGMSVIEDTIMRSNKLATGVRKSRRAPYHVISKLSSAPDRVHDQLEVVAHGEVTVKINGPRWVQETVHLDQPNGPVDQIRLIPVRHGRLNDPPQS